MSRASKWLIIALIVGLILLLLRMKAVAPAGALSVLLGVAALAERVLRLRLLYKAGQDGGVAPRQEMDLNEALELLELPGNPTKEQVKEAHHRLIRRNHPDQGGSKVLAAQINRARDIVMESLDAKR